MAFDPEVLGGGVGAGDSSSGGGIPLPPETDQDVINAVRDAFFLDPDLPADAVDIESRDRVVYLRGVVASEEIKQRAEDVAAQVQGVDRVINELSLAQPY